MKSGQAQLADGLPIPVSGGGVIKLCGGSDGILRRHLPGEEIPQQVRRQQQLVRRRQRGICSWGGLTGNGWKRGSCTGLKTTTWR